MSRIITESDIEEAALEILAELKYKILHGPDIAPDGLSPERQSYSEAVLLSRLTDAIDKLNPNIPQDAKEEAVKKLLRTSSPSLIENNQNFHRMLVNGVDIEYHRKDGSIAGDKVRLFDFDHPKENEFVAVNQFTVIESHNGSHETHRRPDIVLFVNGLPLVVIELKNPADENATIWSALSQFETYKKEIPSLFPFNEILIISDGT